MERAADVTAQTAGESCLRGYGELDKAGRGDPPWRGHWAHEWAACAAVAVARLWEFAQKWADDRLFAGRCPAGLVVGWWGGVEVKGDAGVSAASGRA